MHRYLFTPIPGQKLQTEFHNGSFGVLGDAKNLGRAFAASRSAEASNFSIFAWQPGYGVAHSDVKSFYSIAFDFIFGTSISPIRFLISAEQFVCLIVICAYTSWIPLHPSYHD